MLTSGIGWISLLISPRTISAQLIRFRLFQMVVHVYKKIAMALLVFLILIKAGTATKGIGIGTVETNITLSPMEEHIFYLMLFNPSDTDSNVDLNIYCENCLQDYKVFGNYIGKVNYTVDFIEFPSSVKVEKNTSYMEGKFVEIRIRMPLFIKFSLHVDRKST